MNWKDRYYVLVNDKCERIVVDRLDMSRRYKRMGRAFVNYSKYNGLTYYKHITLTQRQENYKPKFLNNFFNKVRREFGKIVYFWTTEVQERRYDRTGDAVLHWHVIIGFEPDTNIDAEKILKLQRFWPYGNLDVRSVRCLNLKYLLKYITKTINSPLHVVYGIRKAGMSAIGQLYRHSRHRINQILHWFSYNMELIGKTFKVDKHGVYYEYEYMDSVFRKSYVLVFPAWEIVGSFSDWDLDYLGF